MRKILTNRRPISGHLHPTPHTAIEQLQLPNEVSFEHLLEAVEDAHGKPIKLRLVPSSTIPGLSGLWLETEAKSHILVPESHPRLLRMHVICHEFGHILLGHQGCEGLAVPIPSIFNHIGRQKGIRRMLARSPQWNDMEKAAEEVAYMLSPLVLEGPTAPVSRFEEVFG